MATSNVKDLKGAYSPSRMRKGLFDGEGWKCNCNPRQPAAFYQVTKKEGNIGRWFYTCQKKDGDGCNFFLWKDEAQSREVTFNLYNRPEQTSPSKWNPSRYPKRSNAITSKASLRTSASEADTALTSSSKSAKRSFVDAGSETEEDPSDDDWTIIGTVVRRRNSNGPRGALLETPRKERRTTANSSPGKEYARRNAGGDPKEDNIFDTPPILPPKSNLFSKTLTKLSECGGSNVFHSPNKFRVSPPITPSRRISSTSLSDEVSAILTRHSCSLPQHVEDEVLSVLDRQWRQAEGYRRARDISRQHYQTKTAELKTAMEKMACIEQKLALLEAERESEREVNLNLRSRLEELYITV